MRRSHNLTSQSLLAVSSRLQSTGLTCTLVICTAVTRLSKALCPAGWHAPEAEQAAEPADSACLCSCCDRLLPQ